MMGRWALHRGLTDLDDGIPSHFLHRLPGRDHPRPTGASKWSSVWLGHPLPLVVPSTDRSHRLDPWLPHGYGATDRLPSCS